MRRHLALIGIVLALAGLGRLAAIVFHEPLLGYGDQADMIRVGACLGLYPDIPKEDRPKTTFWEPIPDYVFDDPIPAQCVYGSELPIAWLAVAAWRGLSDAAKMDLRWVGGTKLAITALLVLAGCVLLWPFPAASLLHGATFFALIGDPITGLWFNTLYAEVPIILGAYALLVAVAAAALRGTAGAAVGILLVLGCLLLGLSKVQFFLLPLALVLLALPVLWPAGRGVAAVALVAALVPVGVFLTPGKAGAIEANRVDTYLGALAASSSQPLRTLERLGLPARCAPMIGATWFRQRGEHLPTLCPDVFELGNLSFLPLLAEEPGTVAVALAKAIAPSQNVFTGYLGFVAGTRHGRFELVAPWARSLWEPLFVQLRARHYAALFFFVCVAGALCVLAYFALAGRRMGTAGFGLAAYLAMLAACFGYTFATSVLGDGFADMAKHALLASMALAAGLLAGLGWYVRSWRRGATPLARVTTNGIVALSVAAAVALLAWYRELPLAMGVIDSPGDTRLDPGAVELVGWALDPYGVDAIHARVGANRYFGRYGLDRRDVARVFPSLPRAPESGYRIAVPDGALGPAAPDVVVYVTNRRGAETEIDRRRLK